MRKTLINKENTVELGTKTLYHLLDTQETVLFLIPKVLGILFRVSNMLGKYSATEE